VYFSCSDRRWAALNQRSIGALLESLAEDVALAGGEAGLKGSVLGMAPPIPPRKYGKGEACGIQSWFAACGGPCTGRTGARGLCSAAIREWNDRIRDAVVRGVVDAADGAGEVDDAVGLTTLQSGQATSDNRQRPFR